MKAGEMLYPHVDSTETAQQLQHLGPRALVGNLREGMEGNNQRPPCGLQTSALETITVKRGRGAI